MRAVRQHEAHGPDDVRRRGEQHLALDQRLPHQAELVVFEVLGDGRGVAAGRVDHLQPASPRGAHVHVDRAAARDRDQPQGRQALHHPLRKRRELGDEDLGPVHELHDLVGIAEILLQPVHPGSGVAVLHRLVGPGVPEGADREAVAAGFLDLRAKRFRQHEAVADDGDLDGHPLVSPVWAMIRQTGRSASRALR